MANLYFPQLADRAVAQYPIRKIRLCRTLKNVLPDGNMILYADPNAGRLMWELSYADLSASEIQALQQHFENCAGPLHAFTFIDPTDNMLVSSSDLTAPAWNTDPGITISTGIADPEGNSSGFVATNTAQTNQEISQTLPVLANYRYCFSLYTSSAEPSSVTIIRRGNSSDAETIAIGPAWSRVVSSGQLCDDQASNFTIAVSLTAGQQVQLYGLQLEPQIAPSRYRPTTQVGGVYSSAHWAVDQITIVAEAPNLFATSFNIETAI